MRWMEAAARPRAKRRAITGPWKRFDREAPNWAPTTTPKDSPIVARPTPVVKSPRMRWVAVPLNDVIARTKREVAVAMCVGKLRR